jgi:hypothetical protein
LNEGKLDRFSEFSIDHFGGAAGHFLFVPGYFRWFVPDRVHVKNDSGVFRKSGQCKQDSQERQTGWTDHLDSPRQSDYIAMP